LGGGKVSYGVITDGRQHEVTVTRQWEFAPGTILVFDRGYTDYNWFERLTRQGVYFVTRLNTNADIIEVEDLAVPRRKGLMSDQIICITQQAADSYNPPMMHRIEFFDEQQQRTLVFLTNNMKLAAATVAEVYKNPWQIELFFNSLWFKWPFSTASGTVV
jgi:IS4 transposase